MPYSDLTQLFVKAAPFFSASTNRQPVSMALFLLGSKLPATTQGGYKSAAAVDGGNTSLAARTARVKSALTPKYGPTSPKVPAGNSGLADP